MRADSNGEQKVLCFRRGALEDAGVFQGLSLEVERYLPLIGDEENRAFLPRSDAERDFRYKQVIPYVLIFQGARILRYKRGKKSGESRLRGLYSIGVGGHVDERDYAPLEEGYMNGLRREVREETGLERGTISSPLAVINDDSTEVGRVHFGVVHRMQLPENVQVSRYNEIESPEFIEPSEASKNLDDYETWSRLCLECLPPKWLAQPKPKNRL